MMTHNSSQFRIIAVWLVLLAVLCVMIVPSVALAKQEMVIATEGDPTDGFGATGGGSGNLDDDGDQPVENMVGYSENLFFVDIIFGWQNGKWIPVIVFNDYNYWGITSYLENDRLGLHMGAKN